MSVEHARQYLGDWGSGLDDQKLADALLTAGVCEAYRFYDDPEPLAATKEALSRGGQAFCWAAPRRALAVLDAGGASEGVPPWRVELGMDRATRTAAAEWQRVLRSAAISPSVFTQMAQGSSQLDWQWPLRLGFLTDAESQGLRTDLERGFHWPQLQSTVDAGEDCDVLMIPRSLGEAEDFGPGAAGRVGLTVVFGEIDIADDRIPVAVDRLAADLEAWGCHVTDASDHIAWTNALVEVLSHDEPIDDAIRYADIRTNATDRYTALNSQLVDDSRIAAVVSRFAERLHSRPGRRIDIPAEAASTLPLPFAGSVTAEELGSWLEAATLHDFHFSGENHEATGIAALVRAFGTSSPSWGEFGRRGRSFKLPYFDTLPPPPPPPPLPEPEPLAEKRVLNGKVTLGDSDYRRALEVRVDYALDIWIGQPTLESITLPAAPKVPTWELPRGEQWIDVVFACEKNVETTQRNRIRLEERGDTHPATFKLQFAEAGPLFGRIGLLFQGRVMQTAVIRGDVVEGRPSRLGAPEIEVEAIVRASFAALENEQPFDLAIMVNEDEAGSRSATVIKEGTVTWRDIEGLDTAKGAITELLTGIAYDPESYQTITSEASRELLYELAHAGSQLHDAFVVDHEVPTSFFVHERVQVISLAAESLLPVEFFYRRDPPTLHELCPDWEASLLKGQCLSCDALSPDDEIPICLTGFWGIAYVVERHAFSPDFTELPGDYLLQSEPLSTAQTLNPLHSFVWGMSGKVRDKDQQELRNALGSGYQALEANGWSDLAAMAGDPELSMLFLVPHADREGTTPALEIGDGVMLRQTLLRKQLSAIPKGAHVVVVLLGCETANPGIPFQGFVPAFRRAGGVVIISTVATILGRHAVPVAIELLRLMKAGLAAPTEGLGDVLRQLRRRALKDGFPMVLSIVAFGDADWKIAS